MKDKVFTFKRYEFKYLLKNDVASQIEENINNFMRLDPFADSQIEKSYFVRSQYFENSLLTNFYEKVDGMRVRHKYRIRTYDRFSSQSNPIFLEKKGRKLERTMKGRISLSIDALDLIYKEDFSSLMEMFPKSDFIEGFVFDYKRKILKPSVMIDYTRTPYVSDFDTNFRLTFDRNIRVCLPYGDQSVFSLPDNQFWKDVNSGFCTLEVKFLRRFPPWFRRIIQNFNLRRLSISKFSTGIEAQGLAQDTGV